MKKAGFWLLIGFVAAASLGSAQARPVHPKDEFSVPYDEDLLLKLAQEQQAKWDGAQAPNDQTPVTAPEGTAPLSKAAEEAAEQTDSKFIDKFGITIPAALLPQKGAGDKPNEARKQLANLSKVRSFGEVSFDALAAAGLGALSAFVGGPALIYKGARSRIHPATVIGLIVTAAVLSLGLAFGAPAIVAIAAFGAFIGSLFGAIGIISPSKNRRAKKVEKEIQGKSAETSEPIPPSPRFRY